jgi:hypothetical protein
VARGNCGRKRAGRGRRNQQDRHLPTCAWTSLTTNLQGFAGVRVVRSQSAFGFSMVYVVFEDDVDLYFARSRVLDE